MKEKTNKGSWIVWRELREGKEGWVRRGKDEKKVVWVTDCMKVGVDEMERSENGK